MAFRSVKSEVRLLVGKGNLQVLNNWVRESEISGPDAPSVVRLGLHLSTREKNKKPPLVGGFLN